MGQTSPDRGLCRMLTGQGWLKRVDPSGPISQTGTAGSGAELPVLRAKEGDAPE
jgi:hypothetical protein